MHIGAMRLGMKDQILGEGLHFRILRALSLNIASSQSIDAKADRALSWLRAFGRLSVRFWPRKLRLVKPQIPEEPQRFPTLVGRLRETSLSATSSAIR
jgi:hypothetical protein